MNILAIIGTAGRGATPPLSAIHWDWMIAEARSRVPLGAALVSGGAAWADHIAVALFLSGHARALSLHLPAPFEKGRFIGGFGTSGGAANHYHEKFQRTSGVPSLMQISEALARAFCYATFEPEAPGYAAMRRRNEKIALSADRLVAYTFGLGEPADGGTRHTWDLFRGPKDHVTIPLFS